MPETLRHRYVRLCATPSDIFEHLPTLHRLACDCKHVTEFGMRTGISTTALLMALPEFLVAYDICPHEEPINEIARLAKENNRSFEFYPCDTAMMAPEIEETDLLFIDTWHAGDQLTKEFAAAPRVKKYIVLHDTISFGHSDEPGPAGHVDSGGLWPAVQLFLRNNPEWVVGAHYTNCNGMTVLTRGRIVI